jgi:hypothetical protein
MRERRVVLEHEPDGTVLGPLGGDVLAVDPD